MNQWSDEGDFGLHRIASGHTFAEIQAGIDDLDAKYAEGTPGSVYDIDAMTQETASHGVPTGSTRTMSALVEPGTHVVLCAPVVDGRQVHAYVAGGPLEVEKYETSQRPGWRLHGLTSCIHAVNVAWFPWVTISSPSMSARRESRSSTCGSISTVRPNGSKA